MQVGVDGVLYLKVLNPERASYGISDYMFAISQLAQTTLRSEVGKIDLDRTFEERTNINTQVVSELDKASEAWGVKVLRYEIKNITPPARHPRRDGKADARRAREARGDSHVGRHARCGDQHRRRHEAGSDQAVGSAQARSRSTKRKGRRRRSRRWRPRPPQGIRSVAEAIKLPGGQEAVQLRVAEQYIGQFGELAKKSNTIVLPANVADVGSMIALAMKLIGKEKATVGESKMANEQTVLITGATGKQGGATARALAGTEFTLRAMTRNPDSDAAKAVAAETGAELVQGDLNDAASLKNALKGAWGVFGVQNTWEAGVEGEEEQGKRLASLAKEAGVQHYVYTSVGSAHRKTGIPHFDNKYRVEDTIRAAGFPSYVIFRPVFFMENLTSPWFLNGDTIYTAMQPRPEAADDRGRRHRQVRRARLHRMPTS